MKKRILRLFLTVALILSIVPLMSVPIKAASVFEDDLQIGGLIMKDTVVQKSGNYMYLHIIPKDTMTSTEISNKSVSGETRINVTASTWTADANYYVVNVVGLNDIFLYKLTTWQTTFHINGGTMPSGTSATFPVTTYQSDYYDVSWLSPTRPGCTFLGWYTSGGTKVYNANGLTANDGTYWKDNTWRYKGNITLYAKWQANTSITFRYFPNGGVGQPDNFVQWTANATYFDTYPSDSHWNYTSGTYKLTRAGYVATGNYAKKDGSCVVHEDQTFTSYPQLCAAYGLNPDTCGNATIDIYAQWSPNDYTVSFLANGGTAVDSITAPYESSVTLPTPTKTGYTFLGWQGDLKDIVTLTNGMEINDTSKGTIGSNAGYAVTEYLVPVVGGATYTSNYEVCGLYSYDANGNFIKRESSYATTHTLSANAAFVRVEVNVTKGISFDQYQSGLTLTYTIPGGTSFPVGGNQTLKAQWSVNQYTITFDPQGGTTSLTTLPVIYGSNQNNKLNVSTNPTRTDYTFAGWYDAPTGGTQVYKVSNGSCFQSAYWSKEYDVAGNGAVWQYAGNVTLYAHWIYSGISTITFDAQGGTTTLTTLTTTYGSNANNRLDTKTNPTKTGYTFDGWFDAPEGGSQVYKLSNGSCIQGEYWTKSWETAGTGATWKGPKELTLYAHWIPKTYTVTFDANGGSVDTASKSVTYDGTYGDLPTPTPTGYDFAGWYTAAEGGTQITGSSTASVASNHTLYAHWTLQTYTVVWKNYDGSVLKTDTGVAYGTIPSYTGTTPTREDDEDFTYTFHGWSPAVSAVTDDIEYTAQFTAVSKRVEPSYTVTIPATANEGEIVTVSATNVILNTDETLTVTLQSDFTLRNQQNAELAFQINGGAIGNGAVILSLTGNGDQNNPLRGDSIPLTISVAEEAKYAGTYTGTITFTIAVTTAQQP